MNSNDQRDVSEEQWQAEHDELLHDNLRPVAPIRPGLAQRIIDQLAAGLISSAEARRTVNQIVQQTKWNMTGTDTPEGFKRWAREHDAAVLAALRLERNSRAA